MTNLKDIYMTKMSAKCFFNFRMIQWAAQDYLWQLELVYYPTRFVWYFKLRQGFKTVFFGFFYNFRVYFYPLKHDQHRWCNALSDPERQGRPGTRHSKDNISYTIQFRGGAARIFCLLELSAIANQWSMIILSSIACREIGRSSTLQQSIVLPLFSQVCAEPWRIDPTKTLDRLKTIPRRLCHSAPLLGTTKWRVFWIVEEWRNVPFFWKTPDAV